MPLTITTWNVQNFEAGDPLFVQKRNFIIGTLVALGSDVVALQEILDPEALVALAEGLGFHAQAAPPDGRGIRVAFLTRDPVVGAPQVIDQWQLAPGVVVQGFDEAGAIQTFTEFRRPALKITVTHNGRSVDVVTAHLKSKLLTFSGNFSTNDETLRARTAYFALQLRAAEATTLRETATASLASGRDLVVLGDFNDGETAATTQILYGPPGSQPRGPADATLPTGAFQRADQDDVRRLFNVCNLLPPEVRWSRRHNGQPELLDHILASEALMPRVGALRQVPLVTILNEDTPNLIGEHPTMGGVVPDHAPVTAVFV